jgi:hypothetical protein
VDPASIPVAHNIKGEFLIMGVHLLQFLLLAWILVGGSAVSCSPPPQSKDMANSEPDFVSFVTSIDRGGTGEVSARITVESHADKLVERHVVTITKNTVLLRRDGDTLKPTDLDALKPKDWVQLWFLGSPKKPYPSELTAQRLVIVDRP